MCSGDIENGRPTVFTLKGVPWAMTIHDIGDTLAFIDEVFRKRIMVPGPGMCMKFFGVQVGRKYMTPHIS